MIFNNRLNLKMDDVMMNPCWLFSSLGFYPHLIYHPVYVCNFTVVTFCRVYTIFTIFCLDNNSPVVSYSSIRLHIQILQCVNQSSLHVTTLCCTYSCIHQTFPT